MADDNKSTCPHGAAPWDPCHLCGRDAEGAEGVLLDALKWDAEGVSIPEDASKEELKELLIRCRSLLEIVKGKIREKTDLRKEWNLLRRRIAMDINDVEEELRQHNIEKRTNLADGQLGQRILDASIGHLRRAGWTVIPPDKEEE